MFRNETMEKARQRFYADIAESLRDLSLTYRDIGLRHGCTEHTVWQVAKVYGLNRRSKQEVKNV